MCLNVFFPHFLFFFFFILFVFLYVEHNLFYHNEKCPAHCPSMLFRTRIAYFLIGLQMNVSNVMRCFPFLFWIILFLFEEKSCEKIQCTTSRFLYLSLCGFLFLLKILWRKQFTVYANYKKKAAKNNTIMIINIYLKERKRWGKNTSHAHQYLKTDLFSHKTLLSHSVGESERETKKKRGKIVNYEDSSRKRLFSTQLNWIQFNSFFLIFSFGWEENVCLVFGLVFRFCFVSLRTEATLQQKERNIDEWEEKRQRLRKELSTNKIIYSITHNQNQNHLL